MFTVNLRATVPERNTKLGFALVDGHQDFMGYPVRADEFREALATAVNDYARWREPIHHDALIRDLFLQLLHFLQLLGDGLFQQPNFFGAGVVRAGDVVFDLFQLRLKVPNLRREALRVGSLRGDGCHVAVIHNLRVGHARHDDLSDGELCRCQQVWRLRVPLLLDEQFSCRCHPLKHGLFRHPLIVVVHELLRLLQVGHHLRRRRWHLLPLLLGFVHLHGLRGNLSHQRLASVDRLLLSVPNSEIHPLAQHRFRRRVLRVERGQLPVDHLLHGVSDIFLVFGSHVLRGRVLPLLAGGEPLFLAHPVEHRLPELAFLGAPVIQLLHQSGTG